MFFRAITKGINRLMRRSSTGDLPSMTQVQPELTSNIDQNQQAPTQPNVQSTTTSSIPSASNLSTTLQRRSSTANSLSRLSFSSGATPSPLSRNKPSDNITHDNWVRVRIWTSKNADGQNTLGIKALERGNVGHATLETSKVYASIWPNWDFAINRISAQARYLPTPQKDMDAEAGPDGKPKKPDYIFEFYTLDVAAIEAAFKEAEKSAHPWNLFGDSTGKKAFSCSSLTLSLLEMGGLNKLATDTVRSIVSPTSNFVTTPNNLINQLTLAKKIEEYRHPETMDFNTDTYKTDQAQKESFLVTLKAGKVNISNTISGALQTDPEIKLSDNPHENEPRR